MSIYHCIKYIQQLDEDKGKGSSSTCTKTVSERLEEEVRNMCEKFLCDKASW